MNPPPSYHEILKLLNESKLNEMKLIDENERLVKELEHVKLELKVKQDEVIMFHKAYAIAKQSEYKLEKLISKL
jgi:hypothetical protein